MTKVQEKYKEILDAILAESTIAQHEQAEELHQTPRPMVGQGV